MELHTTSDKRVIKRLLMDPSVDINQRNDIGEAPIHTLVRKAAAKKQAKDFDNLWTYLVYCDSNKFDINIRSLQGGDTALHIAAEMNDLQTVKALVIFDADVNCLNSTNLSPMDHTFIQQNAEMGEFLQTRGGLDGPTLRKRQREAKSPTTMPVQVEGEGLQSLKWPPTEHVKDSPGSWGETPLEMSIHNGQRILCLDGGGLKGLILIEVLIHIEKLTGRRIVDLFDWIVGSSTGGIIALALVYAKKTLQELKQLFFQLKDDVFGTAKLGGFGCDCTKFESILKSYFGEEMKMTAVSEPRVMITAVDCRKTDLKLVFFNNCLFNHDTQYMDALVWKVARYTSAAPVYFLPKDGYIDGGIKANNPTDFAITKIQKYYDQHSSVMKSMGKGKEVEETKYACVVSVGCGIFKPDDLGDFSIQRHLYGVTNPFKIFSELGNLMNLLGNAISNEEDVAESCQQRCEKQGIPFYRFNPEFNDSSDIVVPVGETDAQKLCLLIDRAQSCLTTAWDVQIHRLANLLKRVEKSRMQLEGFKFNLPVKSHD